MFFHKQPLSAARRHSSTNHTRPTTTLAGVPPRSAMEGARAQGRKRARAQRGGATATAGASAGAGMAGAGVGATRTTRGTATITGAESPRTACDGTCVHAQALRDRNTALKAQIDKEKARYRAAMANLEDAMSQLHIKPCAAVDCAEFVYGDADVCAMCAVCNDVYCVAHSSHYLERDAGTDNEVVCWLCQDK